MLFCLCYSYKAFINKNHPKDYLSLDEFMKLRQDIVPKTNLDEDDEAGLESTALGIDQPPGADAPPGMEIVV